MKQQYNTALYLRLSRDDELKGESGSISTQRDMLTQYCREQNLNIIGEYVDDGWSGTNFDRPSFQRMIDDIEDGKINCVITKDLSRLIEPAGYKKKVVKNVRIISVPFWTVAI